ncbi:DUF3540 domain-containing protein [Gammaproteobacteria bacterium]|nr:DUF3540 domain-containing protein [Gammaproteobacteria bacterium]
MQAQTHIAEGHQSTAQIEQGFYEASIVKVDGEQYFIATDSTAPQATRVAASCLLTPQLGDHICYWHNNAGTNYIVSVLTSLDATKTAINLAADNISVEAKQELNFKSNNIALNATNKTTQVSQELEVLANKSKFKLAVSHFIGKDSQVNVDLFKFMGKHSMHIVSLMTHQCEKYIRQVSQMDSVKAANMLRSISKLFSLKSNNSILKAKQDMAITAKQINMSD